MFVKRIIRIILFFIAILLLFLGGYFLTSSRTFQFFGELYSTISTKKKVIALTFDDGPSPKTEEILAILEKHNVLATFFLTGNSMHHYFLETKMIVAAGHEIGNHTYSHKRLIFKSYTMIASEIEKTDSIIKRAGYNKEIHFRPPHAKKLFILPYYLKHHNRKTILWDIEPESIQTISHNSDLLANYVISHSNNGSIILLHPMYDWNNISVNALEKIIIGLKQKGYVFKTVSELLTFDSKQ